MGGNGTAVVSGIKQSLRYRIMDSVWSLLKRIKQNLMKKRRTEQEGLTIDKVQITCHHEHVLLLTT